MKPASDSTALPKNFSIDKTLQQDCWNDLNPQQFAEITSTEFATPCNKIVGMTSILQQFTENSSTELSTRVFCRSPNPATQVYKKTALYRDRFATAEFCIFQATPVTGIVCAGVRGCVCVFLCLGCGRVWPVWRALLRGRGVGRMAGLGRGVGVCGAAFSWKDCVALGCGHLYWPRGAACIGGDASLLAERG